MKRLLTRRSYSKKHSTSDFIDGDNGNADSKERLSINIESKDIYLSGILLSLFSIFSYIFDFGSDIYLMIIYYKQENLIWFILTFSFVFFPAIIMTVFSFIWYWSDKDLKRSVFGKSLRIILHLCLLAPFVRYTDTLIYAWRSKYSKNAWDKSRFYQLMKFEEADSALLRIMECSLESAPQLLLQLFIVFTQPQVQNQMMIIIQSVSSILSLISLSWCFTAYQSSLRLTTPGKTEMKIKSMSLMVFWKLLLILPRFLAIALFTSVYRLFVLIVLGTHFLFMAIYIIAQGTTFFSPKKFTLREILFDCVMAIIYCVDFLNLKEGSTRMRYIIFYGVSFGEILVLTTFWYLKPPFNLSSMDYTNSSSVFYFNVSKNSTANFYYQMWSVTTRQLVLLEIITCFIVGIILMIIYYLIFHPTKNIKVCLKTSDHTNISKDAAGDVLLVPRETDPNLL